MLEIQMARSGPMLAEAQWKKIAPLLPKPPRQRKGGRPSIENRHVREGILWILRSGARWQDLPERFPHPSTCWRRLRDWEERGAWLNIRRSFLSELNQRQQLKWSESFLDASFAPAKKWAAESEKPSGARGRSGWWWSTAGVLPRGNFLHSRSPVEVKLAETTLATIRAGRSHRAGRPGRKPMRVITDKAYDSDPLSKRLRQRGIERIRPRKKNRVRPATWDGRALRRNPERWIFERTNARNGDFRRFVVPHDRSLTIDEAFFPIARFMIVLRRVVQ